MQTTEAAPAAPPPSRLLDLAVVLPGALLLTLTLALLAAAALGRGPLWSPEPLTLPEAAALHDDADVMMLIGHGADPNAPGAVRAEILTHGEIMLTPLEAAVGARQEQTVEFLFQHGATVDTPAWTRLMCFAALLEAEEVRAVLERRQPPGTTLDCTGVSMPFEP